MPGASVRTLDGSKLPVAFRGLSRPCRRLYVRGALPPEGPPRVAMVGSRTPTPGGRRAAYDIAFALARSGVVVVSGLARGIDAAAHQGALDAGGITVAFLGCGLDVLYPRSSRRLAEAIPERGALVSEYPEGTPPLGYQFVARNRLVAAYTRGTLVVEAGPQSGALITAGLALEMGGEVWAVPGDPTRPTTRGSNRLLRDGAGCVLEGADLLAALGLAVARRSGDDAVAGSPADSLLPPAALAEAEARVWCALRDLGTGDAEALSRETGLSASQVFQALSWLELAGHVRREDDGYGLA